MSLPIDLGWRFCSETGVYKKPLVWIHDTLTPPLLTRFFAVCLGLFPHEHLHYHQLQGMWESAAWRREANSKAKRTQCLFITQEEHVRNVCMYVYIYTHTLTHVLWYIIFISIHVSIYLYIYNIYVYIYVWTCMYIYTHMCVYTYIIYICICPSLSLYVYIIYKCWCLCVNICMWEPQFRSMSTFLQGLQSHRDTAHFHGKPWNPSSRGPATGGDWRGFDRPISAEKMG